MKKNWTTVLLVIIFFLGLSMVLYPSFANYWNTKLNTGAIQDYAESLKNVSEEDYHELFDEAVAYNEELAALPYQSMRSDEMMERYEKTLSVDGKTTMGYIEIPKLGLSLAVSHGTSNEVLESGVGHLDWSSLPIGGPSTHCVLSGHRGLPSAKLFTNLDQMVVGDTFLLYILNEVLTYEVDQILIVKPEETDSLQIEPGKDYCTLVTCTPYAINTHRLLVRGHRVETVKKGAAVVADAILIDRMLVSMFLAIPCLTFLFLYTMLKPQKKQKKISPQ